MHNRSPLALTLAFATALLLGAAGAQGCRLYHQHSDQHRLADEDHRLLQQMTPIVNQLLQIEQQRQQGQRP